MLDAEMVSKIEDLMQYKIPMHSIPEEVEISEILNYDEIPKVKMPDYKIKIKLNEGGGAFHEKSEKNQKVNVRKTRDQQRLPAICREQSPICSLPFAYFHSYSPRWGNLSSQAPFSDPGGDCCRSG